MINHQIIRLSPKSYGVHLITKELLNTINLKGSGILHLFIQHTSAALALNENASTSCFITKLHQINALPNS